VQHLVDLGHDLEDRREVTFDVWCRRSAPARGGPIRGSAPGCAGPEPPRTRRHRWELVLLQCLTEHRPVEDATAEVGRILGQLGHAMHQPPSARSVPRDTGRADRLSGRCRRTPRRGCSRPDQAEAGVRRRRRRREDTGHGNWSRMGVE
jgi:hypothetical protein